MTMSCALDAVGALPEAVNPFALSLNENPFPPLPSVRSALIASIDAANRYPEFLPERLRSLVAGHVGVRDEQVVIGVGATGVRGSPSFRHATHRFHATSPPILHLHRTCGIRRTAHRIDASCAASSVNRRSIAPRSPAPT